jgi:hypothetical protein
MEMVFLSRAVTGRRPELLVLAGPGAEHVLSPSRFCARRAAGYTAAALLGSQMRLLFGAFLSVVMPRTFWLALICLLAVSVLFAVRTGIGARLIPVATASLADAATASAIDEEPPLAKADRLPSRQFPAAPKKTVSTIETAPTLEPEKARPTASVSGPRTENREVTSWHWHVGSKIIKRTAVVRER